MTTEEAKQWMERMTPDQIANIIKEHYELKQHLCATILVVPTGADDWMARSLREARRLQECQRQLRLVTAKIIPALDEAHQRTEPTECRNCQGRRVTSDRASCVVCHGTGHILSQGLRDFLP